MKICCMNCMEEYDVQLGACPVCGFVRGTPPKESYHLYPEVMLADRYEIGTVVAYGGFGIIYRAWDTKMNTMVAVKEYFPSALVNRSPGSQQIFVYSGRKKTEFEIGLKGFLEEARNTARFSTYENVVNVYDYFEENGTAYLVMEYMDGVSLKQYTKENGGRIDWRQAVGIGCSMADILKIVHAAGILHRDISPDNIMICRNGKIKLFDFGAARFSGEDSEMTRTVILKIGFAPPEQYRKKSIQGPYTDIYALGATLYRSITGIKPEESVNRQEALYRGEPDPLRHPKELVPEIPDYLDAALMKALSIDPELRFQRVTQFKDAILDVTQCIDPQTELVHRKRKRNFGIAAAAAFFAAAMAVCLFLYSGMRTEAALGKTTVPIWICGESSADAETLEAMASDFEAAYPDVKLQITAVPADSYEKKITQALNTKSFPVLYESGGLEKKLGARMADLNGVYRQLRLADYVLLDPAKRGTYGSRQMPLGFSVPVLYGNIPLVDAGNTPLESNDTDGFLAGTNMACVAGLERYAEVQEALPGIYGVFPVNGQKTPVVFSRLLSVDSKASALNRNAAERLLRYLIAEHAQDVLHLQNSTAVPVNRKEFETYLSVNPELAFLKDETADAGKVEFTGQADEEKKCGTLYTALFSEDSSAATLERMKTK